MKRFTIVAAVVLLSQQGWLFAQQETPAASGAPSLGEGRGQVTLTWDEFVKITGYDPSKKGSQSVTIPWAEVESMLGVKVQNVGQTSSVNLPWNEFKSLLEWSIARKNKEDAPPPTDYIITSCQYGGTVSDESADMTLTMKINILKKAGWKKIPVLPATVAITKSTLPEGVFINGMDGAYQILTDKEGAIDIVLAFSTSVTKSAGINQVAFQRMDGTSALLDLVVARKEVDVKVAGSQSLVVKPDKDTMRVAAALPVGQQFSVVWERAIPKVAAAPTKIYAETRTLVAVSEGVLLCQEAVSLNILHTAIREIKMKVPAGVNILDVSAQSLQDWRVDAATGELVMALRGEVIGNYNVGLAFEQPIKGDVTIPVVRVIGAEREKGFAGVIALSNVEIAAGKVDGATQVDVRQMPPDIVAMTNQPILLAFRYAADNISIPLTIKKHAEVGVLLTAVDGALYTVMQLNDGRRMTKAVYTVRNNRNQFLRITMPVGAEIWSASVSGNAATPAKDEKGNILLPLVRSGAGASELASFPVELVYVEKPIKAAPASGSLKVQLPTMDAPAMHVMVNYYLPAEGDYTLPEGLFGRKSGFSGTLRVVESFTTLSKADAVMSTVKNMSNKVAVEDMQKQFDNQAAQQARAAGAEPVRVALPVNGTLFRLEKILALPGDNLYFQVEYTGWKVGQ